MATTGTLRPTRLTSSESDMEELKAHSLFLTLNATVVSLHSSEFVGLTTEVFEKLFERFSKILEVLLNSHSLLSMTNLWFCFKKMRLVCLEESYGDKVP